MPVRLRLRLSLILVALVLAGAALYGIGSIRHPPDAPRAGISVDVPPLQPTAPARLDQGIRVGVFNIRRARGRDLITDYWRTAACMTGVDLLGLNEVDGGTPLDTGVDQARVFGGWMGLHSLFAPVERQFWHNHFGNALLSPAPARHWVNIALPRQAGPSHRGLLIADMVLQDRPVTVMVTHVTRRADRPMQLRAVLDQFRRMPPPVLLLADLNTVATDPMIADIVTDPDVVAVNHAVDWIIARGFELRSAAICDVNGSDHPRLAADLTFRQVP